MIKYRAFIYRGFKKIYKRRQLLFLVRRGKEAKINADLQSKIRDANKGDERSSKLVPKQRKMLF